MSPWEWKEKGTNAEKNRFQQTLNKGSLQGISSLFCNNVVQTLLAYYY